MAPRYEIAIGLARGHKTIKNKQTPRPVAKKGVSKVECCRNQISVNCELTGIRIYQT